MNKGHIPAWKRLGLKLKHAKEEPSSTPTNGRALRLEDIGDGPPSKKRRVESKQTAAAVASANGAREDAPNSEHSSKKVRKQVSFTADTKATDGDTAVSIIPSEVVEDVFQQSSATKKAKKQKQRSTQPSPSKSQGTLDYLNQFYTSHSTWKFNKNREVWILKHAFSTSDIPPSHNMALAQYIHGLKSSNARDRLRSDCAESLDRTSEGPNSSFVSPAEIAEDVLSAFPDTVQADDSHLSLEMQGVPRSRLILWALDPSKTTSELQSEPPQEPEAINGASVAAPQKKRKNRTAVVEYSSSSSSSSDSESDSDSSSDDNGENEST
ncbi:uncharacterized protein HMPREF1541_09270 [Cyphellophora europaea CBS 101466]|uniref:WKF domain-containing protein n=1 Tax=Cyphellophora europaea (strain CBS 101466) TaxID=1220924 RepID=W2SC00_CYPE1|nr:uncharacterized protein HMPREF1541_09270 [Cyphellophora europaea CBS 101466]ETN45439.1 hypothetical protein HMPREF1541_09270 [Cyphellophora europaea CBS 101466]